MENDRRVWSARAWLAVAVLAAVIVVPGVAQTAPRPAAFSNATLHGSYGVLINKWNFLQAPVGAEAIIGVETFDGIGATTLSFTQIAAGNLTTGTGTYSVGANGTGKVSLTLTPGGPTNFAIAINSAGNGFQFIVSGPTPVPVENGTAIAQQMSSFTNTNLKGAYGITVARLTSPTNPIPAVVEGFFSFDGVGKVTGSFIGNSNGDGTVGGQTVKGTYSVASNGTGTLNVIFTPGGSVTLGVVLNAKGKGFQLMQTLGTDTVTGTAFHQ